MTSTRHHRHTWRATLTSLGILTGTLTVWAPSSGAATTNQSPWPMALHDNRHTGTAQVNGPTSGHVLWTRNLEGNITPGPSIGADGSIYIATNSGVLHALDPTTGADQWVFNGGGPLLGETDLSTTPLVLPSGIILWSGPANTLFAISPTGQQVWSHQFSSSPLSPVRNGNRVYVEQMGGSLSALDISGTMPTLAWSLRVGHNSFGSPVVAPNGSVITTSDHRVLDVVDKGRSGKRVWAFTASSQLEVSASVASNGTVEFTTDNRSVYALHPNGRLKWLTSNDKESYSSLSVSGRLAYYGDNSGALHVVNAGNGAPVVTDHGTGDIWSAQAIGANGDVYFGTQGQQIYGFDAKGAQLFDVPSTGRIDGYPALTANGDLIIGDETGTLYDIGS